MKTQSWQVTSLLRNPEAAALARRAGDRLLALVTGLAPKDAVELALTSSGDGQVRITTTITSEIPDLGDLVSWVFDDVASWRRCPRAGAASSRSVARNWSRRSGGPTPICGPSSPNRSSHGHPRRILGRRSGQSPISTAAWNSCGPCARSGPRCGSISHQPRMPPRR